MREALSWKNKQKDKKHGEHEQTTENKEEHEAHARSMRYQSSHYIVRE